MSSADKTQFANFLDMTKFNDAKELDCSLFLVYLIIFVIPIKWGIYELI